MAFEKLIQRIGDHLPDSDSAEALRQIEANNDPASLRVRRLGHLVGGAIDGVITPIQAQQAQVEATFNLNTAVSIPVTGGDSLPQPIEVTVRAA